MDDEAAVDDTPMDADDADEVEEGLMGAAAKSNDWGHLANERGRRPAR